MAQVSVSHKFIHQAPRKLRLVADMVRGLPARVAADELTTVTKTASQVIRKAILAALAAANQQGLAEDQLFVTQIMVDEGPKLRRAIPRSRGQSSPILKRMSHLRVSLSDEPVVIASSRAYKRELAARPKTAVKAVKKEAAQVETPVEAPAEGSK